MKTVILILSLLGFALGALGQTDIRKIDAEIASLQSIEDHQSFWKEMYEIDQTYRGPNTVDSLDKLNLIKACSYFNHFGYPDPKTIGPEASIISTIWIHNKYPKVDLYTFRIILAGHKKKWIDEFDLRDYYLKSMYGRVFPDNGNKSKPLSEIFKSLKIDLSNTIDLDSLLTIYQQQEDFLKEEKITVGIWQAKSYSKTYYLNGSPFKVEFLDDPIIIFQATDQQYYFQRLYSDGSHFPQVLFLKEEFPNRYYLYKQGEVWFEILASGDLLEKQEGKEKILEMK
ncbi:MAG: hypothetical protein R2879_15125 [Saprospiraceae bacterium]